MENKAVAVRTVLASGAFLALFLAACDNYFKNDYTDNSPTSGKLKVFYDEGLEQHVKNQVFTFESQYRNAHLELFPSSCDEAVQALYTDSCESIIISRQLSDREKKAFASRNFFPKYSAVAVSGVALITNTGTMIDSLAYEEVLRLLSEPYTAKDPEGNQVSISVLLDKNNSSVVHYLSDSVLKGRKFSANCNILGSSLKSINHVAKHKNTVAFIDFAWLSDVDDSLYKANRGLIKFIAISPPRSSAYEYPHQSSFKLGAYPFARTVYIYRKTGEFTLAKGFESFVASHKGQLTFLKQGLLPTRQSERMVEINTGR